MSICSYLYATPSLIKALETYQKYLGLAFSFELFDKSKPYKIGNEDFFLLYNSMPEDLKAMDILQGLHTLPPFCAIPIIWLSEELSKAAQPLFDEVEFVWKAQMPFNSNDFFKLIDEVREYYKKNSEMMTARTNLGISLHRKDYQAAKTLHGKIKIDYHHPFKINLLESEILYGMEKYNESLKACEKAKELLDTSLEADVLLSKIYLALGEKDKHQAVLSTMTEKAEIRLKNMLHWGTVYMERGEVNKSLSVYEQAMAKDKKNIEAVEGAVAANLINGREEVAKDIIESAPHALELARVCNMRGIAMANQGQFELAEKLYRNAISFLPSKDDAFKLWMNLGLCMKKKGDYENALEMFDHSKKAAPGNFDRVEEQINHTQALIEQRERLKAKEEAEAAKMRQSA